MSIFGGIHRRFFLKVLAAAGVVATTESSLTGCAAPPEDDEIEADESAITLTGYEYVVVGSGAGGGPLAANLARQGHKVLLLEAGNDQGANLNEQVPAFHARSTEDDEMSWDFFVKHYSNEERAAKDSKMVWETPDGRRHVGPNPPAGSKQKGILYPRAGTLGGCTAHNALITVYPHESDWNKLAQLTGDASWAAGNMRRYYEILARSEYLSERDTGWLGVNKADANLALRDLKILQIVKAAAMTVGSSLFGDIGELLAIMRRDLNEPGAERDKREGLYQIPLAMAGGKRNGPREYLLDTVKKGFPLTIKTNCLATRVLFSTRVGEDGKQKAIGVDFLEGEKLYRATPKPKAGGTKHRVIVTREVILAAGAYNTPQLLKLSGVGPKDELLKFRIPVKVDLPGVGTNLQDRYEVGVVSEVKDDFALIEKCTFGKPGDPCLEDWKRGQGGYVSNGIAVAVVKKLSAAPAGADPDLFVFGGPAAFPGYFPGYSDHAVKDKKHFTWAVLKAHTGNSAGTVTLKSADPRDVPEVNFKYFDEGTTQGNAHERDLQAVYEGVELARAIGRKAGNLMLDDVPLLGGKYEEQVPGPRVQGSAATKEFIKNEAWGHHASCTCPIGQDGDPMAVLDSRFRVRGTNNLRVVDASVFPQIPGFFIVVPIYMISEKATDVMLEDIGEQRRF